MAVRRGSYVPAFQNPEYASPGLQKCSSGVPEFRICFSWAVEMPLGRQNA